MDISIKNKKQEKILADVLEDLYKKIHFLKDEILNLKNHVIKLTLQSNKIYDNLETEEKEIKNLKKLEEFDKEFYIESLITFMLKDKDFEDLQKILDKFEDELLLEQHGET